ncbi:MAG: peptidase C1 [candidate division KSB1 bacterium]|nr:peptidase C1 [candidate division KSB1 bacterium]
MMRFVFLLMLFAAVLIAREPDTARYETRVNFWGEEKEILTFDVKEFPHVRDPEAYDPEFHVPPVRQDTTGTCWCFSAISFLESELERLGRGKVELSRMYIVYWEYVEKVREYFRTHGESLVAEGSQHNAVIERIKQYGTVREQDYSGLVGVQTVYDHADLIDEISDYLDYVKRNALWNEDQGVANVRMILNRHLGVPPQTINVDDREVTPKEYASEILQIPLNDYVALISFKYAPFWEMAEYRVPDNYWHSKDYYNVPLDVFYNSLKAAIRNGYTAAIAGDVSEPGKYGWHDIAVVPSFDIPSAFIDQSARELRFYNESSTDDHGVHLIGYKRYQGEDWFLIKDSASSAWRGEFNGYHFFHGDYIKLKILAYMVHRDAVQDVLAEFES